MLKESVIANDIVFDISFAEVFGDNTKTECHAGQADQKHLIKNGHFVFVALCICFDWLLRWR